MSTQTRDLQCKKCDDIRWDVSCAYGAYPCCERCGGETFVTWVGGQAPSTDVYGSAIYSDATGEYHTSQRDKIKTMKEWGYEEAGDPVGGARKDHTLKKTGFSFGGQSSRRTVAEG